MKLKQIQSAQLRILRLQVELRYRSDGGTDLAWSSYLPRYLDLNERVLSRIKGSTNADISPNTLRRLLHQEKDKESATFNIAYLNAFALYISEGQYDYRELIASWKTQNEVGTYKNGIEQEVQASTIPFVDIPLVGTRTEISGESPTSERNPSERSSDVNSVGSSKGLEFDLSSALLAVQSVKSELNEPPYRHQNAQRSSFRSFARPFLVGALFAGILSFTFVLLFNEISGYEHLSQAELRRLMTSFFGYTVFGHFAIGLALALCTRVLVSSKDRGLFFRRFLLFLPVLFVLTFFTRQFFVSTGWLVMGSKCFAFFGRPDLETVAISLAICLFLFLFLRTIGRPESGTLRGRLLLSTTITLACGSIFFGISALHNILVTDGVIDTEDFLFSPALLSYRFPHPERLPLICFMVFVQTYLTLKFLAERFVERVTPTATNSAAPPHQGFTLP